MRAFGWLSAISLALTGCAAPPAAAPAAVDGPARRVASLNLCTDELLLLLADPGQIASLTHLSANPAESALSDRARAFPGNDGTLASVAAVRPDLVLAMGGAGDKLRIAGRIGARFIDVPFPNSIDDVIASVRTVAAALGHEERGEALVVRIEALRALAPDQLADTIMVGTGGSTIGADGLSADWMALAGYRQRDIGDSQVRLEQLLVDAPAVLLRSDYRTAQYSRGQAWLEHPLTRARAGSLEVQTDGRLWLCGGPLMVGEVERLRAERGL